MSQPHRQPSITSQVQCPTFVKTAWPMFKSSFNTVKLNCSQVQVETEIMNLDQDQLGKLNQNYTDTDQTDR